MNTAEIILLILGIGIFALSFILPEKKAKIKEEDLRLSEKTVKEILEKELEETRKKVHNIIEDVVEDSSENTERTVERLTNEKIIAINEYSDTVLEEINKNHQEVMFLYDMLNDKHKSLLDMSKMIDETAKSSEASAGRAVETAENVKNIVLNMIRQVEEEAEKKMAEDKGGGITNEQSVPENAADSVTKKDATALTPSQLDTDVQETEDPEECKIDNEKILELYRNGMSTIDIARTFELGVGEVRLVIGLFDR